MLTVKFLKKSSKLFTHFFSMFLCVRNYCNELCFLVIFISFLLFVYRSPNSLPQAPHRRETTYKFRVRQATTSSPDTEVDLSLDLFTLLILICICSILILQYFKYNKQQNEHDPKFQVLTMPLLFEPKDKLEQVTSNIENEKVPNEIKEETVQTSTITFQPSSDELSSRRKDSEMSQSDNSSSFTCVSDLVNDVTIANDSILSSGFQVVSYSKED